LVSRVDEGFREAFFDDFTKEFCIVTDFAEGGDLSELIKNCAKEKTHLQEATIWRYLYQICQGLKYLHEMHVIHRDIKGANILLNKDKSVAMLGDMNVSKVAKSKYLFTQTGTPYYASPEVWKDRPYDFKSDIWSLGCLIYELCALVPPFRAKDMESLYARVLAGKFSRIPRYFSEDLSSIISNMLQINPSNRPDCAMLIRKIEALGKVNKGKSPVPVPSSEANLLGTIEIPKDLRHLDEVLPQAKYDANKEPSHARARSEVIPGNSRLLAPDSIISKPQSSISNRADRSSII
jgi:NIMA (never in mitosis gene a)-related kinase 1/4/5